MHGNLTADLLSGCSAVMGREPVHVFHDAICCSRRIYVAEQVPACFQVMDAQDGSLTEELCL